MFEANVIEAEYPSYLLSFSFKWLDEKKVHTFSLNQYPNFKKDKRDDSALCRDLRKFLDEADIVVAQNGDAFDVKKTNARLLVNNIPPPSPYKTIDTLKIARRHFKFDSNKLDNLGKYLGVGTKLAHTGKHLWFGCMRGDEKSWRIMRRYNAQDVLLLEKVYLKLRPWASTHPDLRVYTNHPGCPSCQSQNVQSRGTMISKTRKRQKFQCQDCGKWYSGDIVK